MNRLKQAVFKKFIAPPPLDIDIEDSDRLREIERRNVIRLLNLIARYSLDDTWNPENADNDHKISERIYLSGAFRAWAGILKDVISAIIGVFDENEKKEIFLREILELSTILDEITNARRGSEAMSITYDLYKSFVYKGKTFLEKEEILCNHIKNLFDCLYNIGNKITQALYNHHYAVNLVNTEDKLDSFKDRNNLVTDIENVTPKLIQIGRASCRERV